MRLTSQDGYSYDIPYEKVVLCAERNIIRAYGTQNFDDGRYATMAQYSTPIKAQKAMDLLHRTYTGMLYLENCEVLQDTMKQLEEMSKYGFGILAIKDHEQSVMFEPMNICFRFPQEDELC